MADHRVKDYPGEEFRGFNKEGKTLKIFSEGCWGRGNGSE